MTRLAGSTSHRGAKSTRWFGERMVLESRAKRDNQVVMVSFEAEGKKRLMVSFASTEALAVEPVGPIPGLEMLFGAWTGIEWNK